MDQNKNKILENILQGGTETVKYFLTDNFRRDLIREFRKQNNEKKGEKEDIEYFLEGVEGDIAEYNPNDKVKSVFNTGDFNYLKYLIETNVDINFALSMASKGSSLRVVKYLVENKADVSYDNNFAIINSVYFSSLQVIDFLLENKADITARNNQPIIEAVKRGESKILNFLIENKGDVTAQNNQPLIEAATHGQKEMVKILLENKADATAQNNEPLIEACRHNGNYIVPSRKDRENAIDCVKLLVSYGADVKARNSYAVSESYHFARNFRLIDFLCKQGAVLTLKGNPRKDYLEYKYFSKWRKIVLKKFIRKVILPLYYSPGFPGGEKGRMELKGIK